VIVSYESMCVLENGFGRILMGESAVEKGTLNAQ